MASIRFSDTTPSGTVSITGTAATFTASQTDVLHPGYRITASAQTFTIVSGSGTSWVVSPAANPAVSGASFTYQAVLQSDYNGIAGSVGARFRDWTPFSTPVGPAVNALGTGVLYRYTFRTDYGASFRITELPNDAATMATMLRLRRWLLAGGSVQVITDDQSSRTYAECGLAPEATPDITLDNPADLRYAMSLAVINIASSPVPMICSYANS